MNTIPTRAGECTDCGAVSHLPTESTRYRKHCPKCGDVTEHVPTEEPIPYRDGRTLSKHDADDTKRAELCKRITWTAVQLQSIPTIRQFNQITGTNEEAVYQQWDSWHDAVFAALK